MTFDIVTFDNFIDILTISISYVLFCFAFTFGIAFILNINKENTKMNDEATLNNEKATNISSILISLFWAIKNEETAKNINSTLTSLVSTALKKTDEEVVSRKLCKDSCVKKCSNLLKNRVV